MSSTIKIPKFCQHCGQVFGDDTIADAVLDRVVHTAHRIELKGESMRKKK